MIHNDTYTKEHINKIRAKYPHLDGFIIERTISAFGLLEALIRVKTPFVFKGGTSLILLLDKPYRLSTDIDIIVDPKVDIHQYLNEAAKIFPFIRMEKQSRIGKNNIIKEHFKFYYKSPLTGAEIPILLDVLYEEHGYSKLTQKNIENELIITYGEMFYVTLPSIESILGDKLTAFAPNTTGIEYEYLNKKGILVTKHLEVAKQFLDVAKLCEVSNDFDSIRDSYIKVVNQEIAYRGLNITKEDVLKDTFNVALSVLSKGKIYNNDYKKLIDGIRRIQNHVFGIKVNGESIIPLAADIMLLTAKLITNTKDIKILDSELFNDQDYKSINWIKKIDPITFNKTATAIKILKVFE